MRQIVPVVRVPKPIAEGYSVERCSAPGSDLADDRALPTEKPICFFQILKNRHLRHVALEMPNGAANWQCFHEDAWPVLVEPGPGTELADRHETLGSCVALALAARLLSLAVNEVLRETPPVQRPRYVVPLRQGNRIVGTLHVVEGQASKWQNAETEPWREPRALIALIKKTLVAAQALYEQQTQMTRPARSRTCSVFLPDEHGSRLLPIDAVDRIYEGTLCQILKNGHLRNIGQERHYGLLEGHSLPDEHDTVSSCDAPSLAARFLSMAVNESPSETLHVPLFRCATSIRQRQRIIAVLRLVNLCLEFGGLWREPRALNGDKLATQHDEVCARIAFIEKQLAAMQVLHELEMRMARALRPGRCSIFLRDEHGFRLLPIRPGDSLYQGPLDQILQDSLRSFVLEGHAEWQCFHENSRAERVEPAPRTEPPHEDDSVAWCDTLSLALSWVGREAIREGPPIALAPWVVVESLPRDRRVGARCSDTRASKSATDVEAEPWRELGALIAKKLAAAQASEEVRTTLKEAVRQLGLRRCAIFLRDQAASRFLRIDPDGLDGDPTGYRGNRPPPGSLHVYIDGSYAARIEEPFSPSDDIHVVVVRGCCAVRVEDDRRQGPNRTAKSRLVCAPVSTSEQSRRPSSSGRKIQNRSTSAHRYTPVPNRR